MCYSCVCVCVCVYVRACMHMRVGDAQEAPRRTDGGRRRRNKEDKVPHLTGPKGKARRALQTVLGVRRRGVHRTWPRHTF